MTGNRKPHLASFFTRRLTYSLCAVVLIALIVVLYTKILNKDKKPPLAPLSSLELPLVQQGLPSVETTSLKAYQGKVVLVDFWASWCGPCRQSFPWMNQLLTQYDSQDLAIVAINVDIRPEQAYRFLQEFPANFDVLLDNDAELQTAFNVLGMPTSFLLDRDGRVRAQHVGFQLDKLDVYKADIKALLSEAPTK